MTKVLTDYLNSPLDHYAQNLRLDLHQSELADKRALSLFHHASHEVPAYKDFLTKQHLNRDKIKTIEDFRQVPPVTKENYIDAYKLPARCFQGYLVKTHAFSASSGSSGKPMFWPRALDQEIEGAKMHELLFQHVYDTPQQPTLFINAFGLGNWIAGMFTHNCVYLAKLHGLDFTLATPGYNPDEVFKVVREYSPHFAQTIIACHPPILKIMIESGFKLGINWPKLNVKFLGAGEGFSENWRDYLLSLVGQTDPLRTMINLYGSADTGLMGFETPLSIAIHRETNTNHNLNRQLFASDRQPYLYQFDPQLRYLEAVDDRITITMPGVMPLIRYNIKDHGNILSYELAHQTCQNLESHLFTDWRLPFVYVFGRDEFMITLYGVNIYPENIKAVLDFSALQPFLTGRFLTEKKIDAQQDQYLLLRLELKPGIRPSQKITRLAEKLFVGTLKTINSEYNQVEEKFHEKMHPHLKFFAFNHPKYFAEGKTVKSG